VTDPAYLVAVGGMVGAPLRHLVGQAVERDGFPAGTLTVNVLGSFVLGGVTAVGAGEEVLLLVGTGACGSFTTFSSFAFTAVRLWEDGDRATAVGYALANLLGALGAVALAGALAPPATGR
jgi:CrcB protein